MTTEESGKQIRKFRQQTGMSREEFALKIGMDQTNFAYVEASKRNISIVNIKK